MLAGGLRSCAAAAAAAAAAAVAAVVGVVLLLLVASAGFRLVLAGCVCPVLLSSCVVQ